MGGILREPLGTVRCGWQPRRTAEGRCRGRSSSRPIVLALLTGTGPFRSLGPNGIAGEVLDGDRVNLRGFEVHTGGALRELLQLVVCLQVGFPLVAGGTGPGRG